jgi:invasion protein IalB
MFQSHWVGRWRDRSGQRRLPPSSFPAARQLAPAARRCRYRAGEDRARFVGQHRFGLWTLICEDVAAASAPAHLCRSNALMTVRGPNNAALLAAAFNIVMMKSQPRPGMMFRLPPAASAADNINFAIDGNAMFKAPLKCSPTECLAQGAIPEDAIAQMREGRTLSLIYTVKDRAQQERKVRIDQLLHGFRESYDAMVRAVMAS